jgi:hypothetical protein
MFQICLPLFLSSSLLPYYGVTPKGSQYQGRNQPAMGNINLRLTHPSLKQKKKATVLR